MGVFVLRIKDGYELINRHGQYVVVSKEKTVDMPYNSIVLTQTAIFLWNLLKEKNVTKTEMLDAVIGEFDISTVLALGDIDVFVRTMRENGIIEE